MTFLYFAYGSNMLSARLIARCPSAKLVGVASVDSHSLGFSKKSVDGSGKATLIKQSAQFQTPGVLFEIGLAERDALDKFEGAGNGYDRVDDFRVTKTGQFIVATTYIASEIQNDLAPYDWYLALVVAGALEHGFDDQYTSWLRSIETMTDHVVARKSRVAALRALADQGHLDYASLLLADSSRSEHRD